MPATVRDDVQLRARVEEGYCVITLPSSLVLANRHRCYRTHHCPRFLLFFYIRTWKCLYHYAKRDILCFAIVSVFQGQNKINQATTIFGSLKLQKNICQLLAFSRNMKSTIIVVTWSTKSEIFTIFSNKFYTSISKAILLQVWIIWDLGNRIEYNRIFIGNWGIQSG